MRISDWSSDVCSSDLLAQRRILEPAKRKQGALDTADFAQCGCQRVLLTERRKLFEDQRLRDDLVVHGLDHRADVVPVRAEYTRELMCDRTLAVYREVQIGRAHV